VFLQGYCVSHKREVVGFRATNVTSAVIGNGGSNREAWYFGTKVE
jgi:hypothetical protein